MNSMRKLTDHHIEAYQTFQRAAEGEGSRQAENAMHDALQAVLDFVCTSEDEVWDLYHHLQWYKWKEGDHMELSAKALWAALQHMPSKTEDIVAEREACIAIVQVYHDHPHEGVGMVVGEIIGDLRRRQ